MHQNYVSGPTWVFLPITPFYYDLSSSFPPKQILILVLHLSPGSTDQFPLQYIFFSRMTSLPSLFLGINYWNLESPRFPGDLWPIPQLWRGFSIADTFSDKNKQENLFPVMLKTTVWRTRLKTGIIETISVSPPLLIPCTHGGMQLFAGFCYFILVSLYMTRSHTHLSVFTETFCKDALQKPMNAPAILFTIAREAKLAVKNYFVQTCMQLYHCTSDLPHSSCCCLCNAKVPCDLTNFISQRLWGSQYVGIEGDSATA